MAAWKQWSWRYRAGILFALMLLLQGGACIPIEQATTYAVPGVRGAVYGERKTGGDGRHYYGIAEPGEGSRQRVVYEGSAEYEIIDRFFYGNTNTPAGGIDRAGVPGGSGPPPLPAVQ